MVNFQFIFNQAPGKPIGVISRIFASLFMAIFLAAGVFFTVMIAKDISKSLRTRIWQATQCKIISGKITQKTPYKCELTYTYSFGSKSFTGNLIKNGYNGSDDYYDAQQLLDEYPVGMPATCRVNPANPSEAVLEVQSAWYALTILFPLIFVAVGGGGIYFVWRPFRPALGEIKQPRLVMAIIGSVFFIAGLGICVSFAHLHQRSSAAQTWPAVPCTVVRADVSSHSDNSENGGTTYSVDVLFHYGFAGKTHFSSRYRVASVSTSDYETRKQIADDLMRNPKRSCYVNPKDPADAVLDRGAGGSEILTGIMAAVFTAVGGGLLIAVIRGRNRVKQE